MSDLKTILLLGSGELGKEFAISAKKLGQNVIAVDNYDNAPAMRIADQKVIVNMLNGDALAKVIETYKPDYIVPEVEAIRTEKLLEMESNGYHIIPTALATNLTMNRDAIRNLVALELGLKTANFAYATSEEELTKACKKIGMPCVVKPIMSSSGKGQSIIKSKNDISSSWNTAIQEARGDSKKIIVEEFISFDYEITLLTIRSQNNETTFFDPIGHRQENGDYQESWIPAPMTPVALQKAQSMAKAVTQKLGGRGLFGVEFFVKGDEVYFSELSPRPHDTGMVTMISHNYSEFDLHLRAILGFPLPKLEALGPAASRVLLADFESTSPPNYQGLSQALSSPNVDLRIFEKPSCRVNRRMGVVLSLGSSIEDARHNANQAAQKIKITPKI